MSNIVKLFFNTRLAFFFIGILSITTIKAQYLHVDRVGLNNGLRFSGTIIENQKPDYLIIRTDEYGDIKTHYNDLRYIMHKPNPNDSFYKKGGHQYFSAGFGYGAEYAGLGARLQFRFGRKVGFAHFIGLGLVEMKRPDRKVYNYTEYLYSMDMGTYQKFNFSTGLKFYPISYLYLGAGIQFISHKGLKVNSFFFTGLDFPIFRFLLINASLGYHTNEGFISPTENLMLNFGISYKLTTNPVKSD